MTNYALIEAEQAGRNAFARGCISSYRSAERFARKAYSTILERETFVAAWNQAFWNAEGAVLRSSTQGIG